MSELSATGVPNQPGAAAAIRSEQYLTFMLAGETYALGILAIKEIIEYTEITDVPMMPSYLRGVINLRGAVVPVVDLSVRFGKPANAVSKRTCIVIIEVGMAGERHDIGLVVDAVNAVLEISSDDIEPAPAFGTNLRTDFIQGMGKVNGKFVILLELDHILAFEDMGLAGSLAAGTALATGPGEVH